MNSEVSETEQSYRDKYPPKIREWWEKTLGSPRLIVAPMVDASELAWRMLSRRYKADLCFTPMLHSRIFSEELKYRVDNLFNCVCAEDRPLIVQFCGNNAAVLVKAAQIAKPYCDGVDLNLGCPQAIAKKGHYGAFLMEEWDRVSEMVKRVHLEVGIPISCKIRVFKEIEKTIQYAKMLEAAGCFMLTVHGRTLEQKGPKTGIASWDHIKAVRSAVNIPVVANGNIQYLSDAEKCIEVTGVEGVMSAEGNLHNPKIFTGDNPPVWEMGLEYIELTRKYPCPLSYSRGHLFKLFQHVLSLTGNEDIREQLGKGNTIEDFLKVTMAIKSRYEPYVNGELKWIPPENNEEIKKLKYAAFICQPYVRPPFKPGVVISAENQPEPPPCKPGVEYISKKRLKRMQRNPHKKWGIDRIPLVLCTLCVHPGGLKCDFKCCKRCCKRKCLEDNLDCEGHRVLIKSDRAFGACTNADVKEDSTT